MRTIVGPEDIVMIGSLRPGVTIFRYARIHRSSATAPMPCHQEAIASLLFGRNISDIAVQRVTCHRCFLAYDATVSAGTQGVQPQISFQYVGTVLVSRPRKPIERD